ncbi:Hsp20 family protein [Halobacillus halophilus]|nr:Hsp20 family protein [Halobacillus halophilus]
MDDKKSQLPDFFEHTFMDLIRAVDSFFDHSLQGVEPLFQGGSFPVDIYETNGEIVVEAVLTDVQENQIRIDRSGRQLRILIEQQQMREVNDEVRDYYRRTHFLKSREQTVELPFEADPNSSRASFQNGVLKVVFHKRGPLESIPIEE